MKNISSILYLFISRIFLIFIPLAKNNKNPTIYENNKKCKFVFLPKEIVLKDDAFHSSKSSRFTEWWYFDAVFENGYSAQMAIRVLSIIKNRLVLVFQRLDIYKDGRLIKHNKKRIRFKKFNASYDKPSVKLAGKEVIKGHVDESSSRWIYDVIFEIDDYSANLRFEGITNGFKGKVPASPGGDWWAVSLPRAKVTGKIKINNEEIDVQGTGYHDHNWDVKGAAALKNLGWFWGKINTKNYTITWATIFKTIDLGQSLLVINKKNGGFINVTPDKITFIGKDLYINHKKQIPHEFILQAKNEKVDLNFKMKTLDIHFEKTMMIMKYWRYHVICTGWIKIDDEKELVNETHIAELLRFK